MRLKIYFSAIKMLSKLLGKCNPVMVLNLYKTGLKSTGNLLFLRQKGLFLSKNRPFY